MMSNLMNSVDPDIQRVLQRALDGDELQLPDVLHLSCATGRELHALIAVADELRRRHVGDDVTYVINRNINFTNVCVKACHFCAFSRKLRAEDTYLLDIDAVVSRAAQAVALGATEICLQAGLAPDTDANYYLQLISTLRARFPQLHLHALSPEEVKHGARQGDLSIERFLKLLKEAGLSSMPGTSAEILDDELRDRISPGRITTSEWLNVVQTAHSLGIRTTSTMMFGHVETPEHRARHMLLLRDAQLESRGFTEFVPLSFVHAEAPMFAQSKVPGVQPGPTGNDVIRLYAIARLVLGPSMRNLQASWVKEGLRMSQWLLDTGCNDLGGTLMNEAISTQAGASHGQLASPATLRHLIRSSGRVPVQRNTLYDELARFDDATTSHHDPLDEVADADTAFGSYEQLSADPTLRYTWSKRDRKATN